MNDLIGRKFGRLTVLERYPEKKKGYIQWVCECQCGNIIVVRSDLLKSGNTRSCGCLAKEIHSMRCRELGLTRATHKKSNTRLYKIYANMKDRCYNKNNHAYKDYGLRGITICKEWLESFNAFYEWAINNGYGDNLTIDRKNNNSGYSPNNCRWITRTEQSLNTRHNKFITYNNKTQTLKEWTDELGLSYSKIWKRLYRGWCFERAIKK